ncbi:hypothetical protein [Novosphingobium mathurense]|uniref:Phage regulatory protein CII (CP76) n=1 Tax=Novosphingobium mathurense TaxID=428990 RepID=A0A1U6I7D9_9SPHN|nr:hypothetical protein [Novosphingobium mathurense]SLK03921.1 hypothetical protein SAMN06295987_104307 [Novosphingobium mathurense]
MGETMTLQRNKVFRAERPSRETFRELLANDWLRCFPNAVRGAAADAMGCDKRTIANTIAEAHLPDSYTLVMSLLADKTALDGLLSLVGMKAVPLKSEAANDLHTISSLSNLAGQFASALEDGHRDHRETCQLADAARPLMKALAAICSEADTVRAA